MMYINVVCDEPDCTSEEGSQAVELEHSYESLRDIVDGLLGIGWELELSPAGTILKSVCPDCQANVVLP